jgi:DNA-binding response OmpR family regulator
VKLLLVDDDDTLTAALQRGLRAEGFTVEVVRDGIEAVWRARDGGYDLILLDVMLPGRNGYRVCAELREGGNRTPILMLTAKDGALDETEGLDTGADDYLRKPFSFRVLVSRIHALLRRAALGDPPPMQLGDLRVEPRHRRVLRGDTEIALTAREFDLLSYLVRRPGQVVPKSQLLAGVWEDDFEGDPNVVEVYVGRLRRKIDEPFARRTLETVRGAGYRVVPS